MTIGQGIYFNMHEAVYRMAHGVSHSALKHLHVSPLQYWDKCINPDREVTEETYPQMLGKAMHTAILEPTEFTSRYAKIPSKSDFDRVLDTMDDLKAYCEEIGLPTTAKRKQDLIDRIIEAEGDDAPVIWDIMKEALERDDKIKLKPADFDCVIDAAKAIEKDPVTKSLFTGGFPEVSIFVEYEGKMLKGRIDYMRINTSLDLKSFNNARGKNPYKAMTDALYYEDYFVQAVYYHKLRELARQKLAAGEIEIHGAPEGFKEAFLKADGHSFGIVFVESSRPYHTAAYALKPKDIGGQTNIYWSTAEARIERLLETYAECWNRYGKDEWREPIEPRMLSDLDLPQLMFS